MIKNSFKVLFCLVLISIGSIGYSQTIDSLYEVGIWQGFRTAAVSYTFDDNCPNQLSIAVPMFNEFDFKLTLFTVTSPSWGWPAKWNQLQEASYQGHEIASHTVTHTSLSGMEDSMQETELKNSQDAINSHITNAKCLTIAYPYCNTGNNSIVQEYYFAARGCSGQIVSRTPSNFMNISSFVVGSEGSIKTSNDFKSKVNSAANVKGWVVYLIHGINGNEPGAYSPISEDTIRKSLEYLYANPEKFWVATFGNVAGYIRERNCVSVEELSFEDSVITVSITDTLDNSIFNFPVTIRRELPDEWSSVIVTQNDDTLTRKIVEINSKKYVMFDAVPDEGDVVITGISITNVEDVGSLSPTEPRLMQNYPNPFNPSTKIRYSIPQLDKKDYGTRHTNVKLKVYDVLGNEIATLVDGEKSAGTYEIVYNASSLSGGIYFYQLTTSTGFMQTKKFALLK